MKKYFKNRIKAGAVVLGLMMFTGFADAAEDQPSEIGIDEIIPMALANTYSIRIVEAEVLQSELEQDVSAETFESQVSVSASEFRDSNSDPNSFPFSVSGASQNISIEKAFDTGTNVSLQSSNTKFDELAIPRSGETSLTVNQALLRGSSRDFNRARILIAGKRLNIAEQSLRQTVIDTVSEVQFAYYDGVLAQENLRVAHESLDLARQLLMQIRRRSEIGSIASTDILQAEAEVAAREERVYLAESALVQAKNRIKRSLSDQVVGILDWDFSFETPNVVEKSEVSANRSFGRALELRPDYQQAILNLEIGEIEVARERHASLTSVNLYARMSMEGFGRSFRQTYNDLDSDKFPDYTIGLNVTRSISNRAAEARIGIASLENNRRELTIKQLEQAILLDLDSAAAQVENGWNRLESARTSSDLAQKSLEAEQKRFQRGTSSTFILIRLQTDLVNAQIREVAAENEYRKALVQFDRQAGVVLLHNNIAL